MLEIKLSPNLNLKQLRLGRCGATLSVGFGKSVEVRRSETSINEMEIH